MYIKYLKPEHEYLEGEFVFLKAFLLNREIND
jgi:hypothetical protein